MQLRTLLPVTLLVASAAAQNALIYDNGPIVNFNGLAILQTSVGATPPAPSANFHTVFGFGQNNTASVTVADDFSVAAGAVINEVELFYYQTGASAANPGTCTGVFLEFLSAAPSAGGLPVAGSPGFANNLFGATVTHAFTNVYKVQDVAQTATNRPIFAIKVALPNPVVLTPGVYYLQWALTGSLASGPWCPPVSTLNQAVTGNAEQKAGAAAAWLPIVSGTPTTYAQGLPFRLYGAGGTPGSIVQTASGCGATGISVEGAPNTGGYVRTTLSGVVGLGIIGFSFNVAQTPFCGCTFSHGWDIQLAATSSEFSIPQTNVFCGLPIGIQGVDFGAPGGCPIGFTVTNGFVVTLNN